MSDEERTVGEAPSERIDTFRRLRGLYDDGVLTREQFEAERYRWLSEQPADGRGAGDATAGPTQVLVLELGRPGEGAGMLEELDALREQGSVRTLDLAIVRRRNDGGVELVGEHEPGTRGDVVTGALIRPLLGLDSSPPAAGHVDGAADRGCSLVERIPRGTTAVVALVEHRWAGPLLDAATAGRAHLLAQAWMRPADLAAIAHRHDRH